jgi:hypothetical protein
MKAICTSEISVNFKVTTWCYIPEDSKLHTRCRENLKSHMIHITFHSGSKNEVTEVVFTYPNKPCTMKPNMVLGYIKHMEGVDHYIAFYQFIRGQRNGTEKCSSRLWK